MNVRRLMLSFSGGQDHKVIHGTAFDVNTLTFLIVFLFLHICQSQIKTGRIGCKFGIELRLPCVTL